MPLRLTDVARREPGLTPAEAVAVVLAALDQRNRRQAGRRARLPSIDDILLDSKGHLSFGMPGADSTDAECVQDAASMLQRLLRLDVPPGATSPNVPGALLVLISRATGTIDLPPPSLVGFRHALRRFGSADPATLANLYRKCAVAPVTGGTTGPRASRIAALAASLLVTLLGMTWALSRDARHEPSEPSVTVVHERTVVPMPPGTGAGSPGPARGNDRIVTARPLLSAAAVGNDVFSPAFGSHGHELLFHAGRTGSALLRASFDVRGRPAITTVLQDGSANYHAALSPDGRWLAFDSDRDGTRGVYVAPSDFADALAARKISGHGYAAIPRWSPDGRQLAFVKAERDRPRVWNVWVATLGARTLSRVSNHRVGQAWGASWFPSGDRLAYSVEDTLVLVDLGRRTSRTVPSPQRGQLIRTPAVSPDGRWIVFQVHRDGAWLLEVSSGRMRRVLDDGTAEEFAWSPDSSRVVYHTKQQGAWSLWQFAIDPPA